MFSRHVVVVVIYYGWRKIDLRGNEASDIIVLCELRKSRVSGYPGKT